jgi:hypothetical protein
MKKDYFYLRTKKTIINKSSIHPNMIKQISLVSILFMCSLFKTNAQVILPADRIDMILEASPSSTTIPSSDSTFSANTPVTTKLIIVLQDTVHLSKIYVKFGLSSSNYNLLNKTFMFDVSGTLSDGTSYSRVGNVVYLTLGTYVGLQNGFAEVKLEDTYARLTDPVVVSGN